jgi:hypothetical protein
MGRSNTDYRLSLGGRTHATRELHKKACEEVMRIVNLTQKRNKI